MAIEAVQQPGIDTPTKEQKRERQRVEREASRFVLGPVSARLAVASIVVLIASAAAVAPFVLIVEASRALLADDGELAWRLIVIALALLGARGLLYSGTLLWTHLIDSSHQLTLRRLLAAKLARVPLGWFTERSSGEVKKLLQDDIEAVHYLVAHARVEFVSAVAVPALTFVYLFVVDWRLALVLLAPLFGYGIALSVMMGRGYREKMDVYYRWEKRTEAATVEFVDGIQVVRAFGQAGRSHHRFQLAVDGFAKYFRDWATPITRLEAGAGVLLNPVFLLALVLTVGLVLVGTGMPPVNLLPFVLLGIGLGSTVLTVGYAAQALTQARAAMLRLHELQQTDELRTLPAEEPEGDGGLVRFEGVSFGYREDREVLRGVDLELRPGTITALVGPSGSGKSTLARLLPRFFDVGGGRITIGGRDLRSVPAEELYRLVGFVFQDVRLLDDTVRANIALARPGASEEEIERAARAAQIHDRILELPRRYDSVIGQDARLSGGEAQRLSIARALLADAPILVLDEATAFSDPESEAAIQDALAELVADRTVLVIAHRLHTIVGVDRLVVLDAGRVVEEGAHEELLAADGLYRRLWDANEAAVRDLASVEGVAGSDTTAWEAGR